MSLILALYLSYVIGKYNWCNEEICIISTPVIFCIKLECVRSSFSYETLSKTQPPQAKGSLKDWAQNGIYDKSSGPPFGTFGFNHFLDLEVPVM